MPTPEEERKWLQILIGESAFEDDTHWHHHRYQRLAWTTILAVMNIAIFVLVVKYKPLIKDLGIDSAKTADEIGTLLQIASVFGFMAESLNATRYVFFHRRPFHFVFLVGSLYALFAFIADVLYIIVSLRFLLSIDLTPEVYPPGYVCER